jgi:hypothetical protein
MAYVNNNDSLRRILQLGFIGDATSYGAASAKFLYSYATADAAATVEVAGYFDGALFGGVNPLNPGDVIMATMVLNGTPVLKNYVVLTNAVATGGHVTIGLQTATAG